MATILREAHPAYLSSSKILPKQQLHSTSRIILPSSTGIGSRNLVTNGVWLDSMNSWPPTQAFMAHECSWKVASLCHDEFWSYHPKGFDWKNLPKDSICVDVGGCTGSLTKILLEANPHLKFVVQDLPGPIKQGQEVLLFDLTTRPETNLTDMAKGKPWSFKVWSGPVTRWDHRRLPYLFSCW